MNDLEAMNTLNELLKNMLDTFTEEEQHDVETIEVM